MSKWKMILPPCLYKNVSRLDLTVNERKVLDAIIVKLYPIKQDKDRDKICAPYIYVHLLGIISVRTIQRIMRHLHERGIIILISNGQKQPYTVMIPTVLCAKSIYDDGALLRQIKGLDGVALRQAVSDFGGNVITTYSYRQKKQVLQTAGTTEPIMAAPLVVAKEKAPLEVLKELEKESDRLWKIHKSTPNDGRESFITSKTNALKADRKMVDYKNRIEMFLIAEPK